MFRLLRLAHHRAGFLPGAGREAVKKLIGVTHARKLSAPRVVCGGRSPIWVPEADGKMAALAKPALAGKRLVGRSSRKGQVSRS